MGLVKGWLGAGGTLWEKNRARRARLGQTDVYLQPPEGYKTNSGLMGMSLLTANWLFAVFFVGGFLMMRGRIPMEERRLIEKFGDEYRSYMGRTGRFFPRLLA